MKRLELLQTLGSASVPGLFMDRGASAHIHVLDLRTGGSPQVPGCASLIAKSRPSPA